MNQDITKLLKNIIVNSISKDFDSQLLTDDFELVGNLLDSMSVTNLVVAIEEQFNFVFEDDDLSAEAFETFGSLKQLLIRKINTQYGEN